MRRQVGWIFQCRMLEFDGRRRRSRLWESGSQSVIPLPRHDCKPARNLGLDDPSASLGCNDLRVCVWLVILDLDVQAAP